MGTDSLFEQYTIKEIQDIEKKLRHDIERKKEDLRQLVGERYRDFMEAADTITEMKKTSQSVVLHIKTMQDHCVKLQQSTIRSGLIQSALTRTQERKKGTDVLYAIAAQVKLLMDAPTKIWEAIESGKYLNAALLYLLARHIHMLLILDPMQQIQEGSLNEQVAIINHQWTTISQFKQIILEKCHERLQHSSNINDQDAAETLCSCILLMDSTPQNVFQEFLKKREMAIQSIFQPEKHGTSAKSQVCELVFFLVATLQLVHAIFYSEDENEEKQYKGTGRNLLLLTLNKITSSEYPGPVSLMDLDICPTYKYLPVAATEFRPNLKTKPTPVNVEYLQAFCNDWITIINESSSVHLVQLLDFVGTAKGLANIREAVGEQLSQIHDWSTTCNHLLNRKLSIWETFLQPIFLDRVKSIIKNHLEFSISNCTTLTKKSLKEISDDENKFPQPERDTTTYVWTESQSDLTSQVGWVSHHQRSTWESGTLTMKAHGYTPKVQIICRDLDSSLESLIKDVSFFISDHDKQASDRVFSTIPESSGEKIDVHSDIPQVYSHLKLCAEDSIKMFLKFVKQALTSDSHELKMLWPVTLGHLCRGFTELCPHLKQCIACPHTDDPVENPSHFRRMSASLGHTTVREDPNWNALKEDILDHSNSAFRIWTDWLVEFSVSKLSEDMEEYSMKTLLKTLLQWDHIEIQEESEEGGAVKSTISIPLQISVPLYNALFNLCSKINQGGGHSLQISVKKEIIQNLFSRLVNLYDKIVHIDCPESLSSAHLLQTRALQFLFDIQFISGLMGPKEGSNDPHTKKVNDIILHLENQVDPFDLDVFMPSLQSNIRRALHRSSLLLGLLTNPDRLVHVSGPRNLSQPSQTDQFNVMPISIIAGRFHLLPIADKTQQKTIGSKLTTSERLAETAKENPLKASRIHSSSPNLSESPIHGSVSKSSSFYDRMTAMSNSWFGGN